MSSIKNMKRHYLSSLKALEFSVFQEEHKNGVYPNWMRRYFESLTEGEQWDYFLAYRNVADQMVSESYLVDHLKWILKYPTIELEYNIYAKAVFDPDFYESDVFRPGKWDKLQEKYAARLHQEEEEINLAEERRRATLAFSPKKPEDTLPF
ncbi:hypothetical protein [Oceanobacillus sojae]|uniref:hypothetical protein n=1 Tax=Oceanobacillus sojae TaxID=582851 RepID=UPI00111554BD|nr:hypothetical protein [Oceanobacillus sojae]